SADAVGVGGGPGFPADMGAVGVAAGVTAVAVVGVVVGEGGAFVVMPQREDVPATGGCVERYPAQRFSTDGHGRGLHGRARRLRATSVMLDWWRGGWRLRHPSGGR